MLKTYYDYDILRDLMLSKPSDFLTDKFQIWLNYLKFIHSGTDLFLTNLPDDFNETFLNGLTAGRGESKLSLVKKLNRFYKNKVPSSFGPDNLFFFDDDNETEQKKYRENNSHFFGFINDHFNAFKRFAHAGKSNVIPVRKGIKYNRFSSWAVLNDYLLPFSDCVIIDNYIFSKPENVLEQNIEKILIALDQASPVRYNLLIITYYGIKKEIEMAYIKSFLEKLRKKAHLKGNISVILTHKIEHDRNIFMNYMRINSKASFNYFDFRGKPDIRTEIEFLSYLDNEKFMNARIILDDIYSDINKIIERADPEEVYGDCKSRLI